MELDKTSKEKLFDFIYSNPLLHYIHNWGHIVTEQFLPENGLILDLGAGTSEHQSFAKPSNTYVALDIDMDVLRIGREAGRSHWGVQSDAQRLPFADGSFDGVVTVYSMEHLSGLANCVDELARILKPGSVLAVAIPTEGLVFRLGRRFVTAPFAAKNLGFESPRAYEDYVASEHINLPDDIISELERYFNLVEKRWFPFFIASKDLNMLMAIKAVRSY